MSPADEKTLMFYGENARAYAEREIAKHTRLKAFLARLAAGADDPRTGMWRGRRLGRNDRRSGFDARPTDGAPEMAAEASRRLGRPRGDAAVP